MEESRMDDHTEHSQDRTPNKITSWLNLLSVIAFVAALFGVGYVYQQSRAITDLTIQNQSLNSIITQMRSQIATLTDKFSQLATPPPITATPPATSGQTGMKRAAASVSSTQDRRLRRLQTELDDQQKQLKETEDELASAKTDFAGQLGSTHDELNGSIAKTHEELVALEKRGERSYYEFDLNKSTGFEREGPISLSLRKADTKHQSYDLIMLVDDHELWKRKVDLYEPIWLHQSRQPQPVQVVVNRISRNHIHGYVSAPKYGASELAVNNPQPTSLATSGSASAPSSPMPTSTTTPTPATSPSSTPVTPPQQTSRN